MMFAMGRNPKEHEKRWTPWHPQNPSSCFLLEPKAAWTVSGRYNKWGLRINDWVPTWLILPQAEWPFVIEFMNEPKEATIRLIWADFVEERGEYHRAEYIRETTKWLKQ